MVLFDVIIGEEAVLSRCCNALTLITIPQAQFGKINCMSRSCLNSFLEYIKLDAESIAKLFEEAERMISRSSQRYKGKKILYVKHKPPIHIEIDRSKRNASKLNDANEGVINSLMLTKGIKRSDIDLRIEMMQRFPKLCGGKRVALVMN